MNVRQLPNWCTRPRAMHWRRKRRVLVGFTQFLFCFLSLVVSSFCLWKVVGICCKSSRYDLLNLQTCGGVLKGDKFLKRLFYQIQTYNKLEESWHWIRWLIFCDKNWTRFHVGRHLWRYEYRPNLWAVRKAWHLVPILVKITYTPPQKWLDKIIQKMEYWYTLFDVNMFFLFLFFNYI